MSTNEYKPSAPENEDCPEGTIIEEKYAKHEGKKRRYTKGKFLGKGGFAKCYEFTSLDTKKVLASKVIPKASLTKNRAKQKLISEIKIHQSIIHKNVVGFEHYFEDHENVYILLELCTNQTMNELLRRRKRLTELEVQCYMGQILDALKYLHNHRIIHRDLKLGNLFLNEKMEIKLGDFGLAAKLEFDGEKKKTICGTPNYIAPEILEGKCGHSYEVDIWSLGVICYTLLIGKPPFETNDVKTTYRRIRMNAYSFPEHITISAHAKDLITKILNTNPAKRPTIDEILEHPFMSCGYKIPSVMPVSTLACPPSTSFLKQFVPNPSLVVKEKEELPPNTAPRFEHTAPSAPVNPSNPPINPAILTDQQRQPMKERNPGRTERERFFSSNPKNGYELGNVNNNNIYDSGKKTDSVRLQTAPGALEKELIYPSIWVKKWVDYSSKYGMGYILSNGSVGVYFNDSTKILMYSDGKFEYIERKGADKVEVSQKHNLQDFPKELQKKVTLLNHFKSYLESESQKKDKNGRFESQNGESLSIPLSQVLPGGGMGSGNDNVYVKKWMRSKHAIMFRLSNKVVQVIFQDQTEILLSSEQRVVTYVNKKHERLNFPLSAALESNNQEMGKRLKYTKDILTQLLNGNKEASNNKYATENANLRKTAGPKTTSTVGFGSPITSSSGVGLFSRMGSYKTDDMLASDINSGNINGKSLTNFIRSNTDGHNPSLSTHNFFSDQKNYNI